METNSFEVKAEALAYAMFPQLPNFCAVAACCGALGAILQRPVTQQELHAHYQVGLYTKLKAPAECDPNTFANLQRSGKGFSNWDVIRLCNAVLLDNSRVPAAAILCGQDFVRETSVPERLDGIFDWLRSKTCQAIVHILGHYTLCAGTFASAANGDRFLLLADSAKRSGPLRSLRVAELTGLAAADERYGVVLVSDHPLPQTLFQTWTDTMLPPEVTEGQRFSRIDRS